MFTIILMDKNNFLCQFFLSMKRLCFKTLVDEVQELEALSKDPGAVVHGKR